MPKVLLINAKLLGIRKIKNCLRKIQNKRLLAKFGRRSLNKIGKYNVKRSIDKIEKVLYKNVRRYKGKKKG